MTMEKPARPTKEQAIAIQKVSIDKECESETFTLTEISRNLYDEDELLGKPIITPNQCITLEHVFQVTWETIDAHKESYDTFKFILLEDIACGDAPEVMDLENGAWGMYVAARNLLAELALEIAKYDENHNEFKTAVDRHIDKDCNRAISRYCGEKQSDIMDMSEVVLRVIRNVVADKRETNAFFIDDLDNINNVAIKSCNLFITGIVRPTKKDLLTPDESDIASLVFKLSNMFIDMTDDYPEDYATSILETESVEMRMFAQYVLANMLTHRQYKARVAGAKKKKGTFGTKFTKDRCEFNVAAIIRNSIVGHLYNPVGSETTPIETKVLDSIKTTENVQTFFKIFPALFVFADVFIELDKMVTRAAKLVNTESNNHNLNILKTRILSYMINAIDKVTEGDESNIEIRKLVNEYSQLFNAKLFNSKK